MLHVLTRIIKAEFRKAPHHHHTSMINDAVSVAEHFETLREINSIIDHQLEIVSNVDGLQIIHTELSRVAKKYYSNLSEIEEITELISKISFNQMREYFNEIELIELNRRDQEIDERVISSGLDPEEFGQEIEYFEPMIGVPGLSYIVTGGARISRGLTLEGLTISFFLRRAEEPNYDTMLQMSRWCGYRNKKGLEYGDLVRIITTPQIYSDYGLINEAEINMRNQLNSLSHESDPIEEVVWIQEQRGLNVSGKMPLPEFITRITEYDRVVRGEIWSTSPPELYCKNDNNFREFFALYAQISGGFSSPPKNENNYILAKNVDSRLIRYFLSSYSSNLTDPEISSGLASIITELDKHSECNVSIATPEKASNVIYIKSIDEELKMVRRAPNSQGFIPQVYSNYGESIAIDLNIDQQGILESRTKPLIAFYLGDNSIKNGDGELIFPNCNYPIPLFGIIMPATSTVIESRQYVRGYREHNVRRPSFGGRNNE